MKRKNIIIFLFIITFVGNLFSNPMSLKFNTVLSDGTTITLPLYGTVNVIVNWGDGISENITSAGDKDHTYSSEGIYTVTISGMLTHFGNGSHGYSNTKKLIEINDFGNIGIVDLSGACWYATNLTKVPPVLPDGVTNMALMFAYLPSFNQDISSWDVSNVTNMSCMFLHSPSFNQPLNSWDVSKVTNMFGMFGNATLFNQPLNSWNVSKVTNMSCMFDHAVSFNQNINSWDVSKVTNMCDMFKYATLFNQPLNSWNVSKVTNMSGIFWHAISFNQNINSWDVSNVTNMNDMFASATLYNQPLNSWNVGNVIEMLGMFSGAVHFNQPLNLWDVSNVCNMYGMFYRATSFDQNLGSWDVSKVPNMTYMFTKATLSTSNYDSLLIGWSALDLKSNVPFDGGHSKYSQKAANARQKMIDYFNWTFIDGGVGIHNNLTLQTNLNQNYPNPFNPQTTISYSLAKEQNVKIIIYNALGKIIAKLVDCKQSAGMYSVKWNPTNIATGFYFIQMETLNYSKNIKALFIK